MNEVTKSPIKKVIVPQENVTKEMEIKAFNDFLAALPKETYLYSILEGMGEYCTGQICSDFAYGPLETISSLHGDINNLQLALEEKAEKYNASVDSLNRSYNAALEVQEEKESEIDGLKKAVDCLRNQLSDAAVQCSDLESKTKKDQQLILELKAQIYDLMTAPVVWAGDK